MGTPPETLEHVVLVVGLPEELGQERAVVLVPLSTEPGNTPPHFLEASRMVVTYSSRVWMAIAVLNTPYFIQINRSWCCRPFTLTSVSTILACPIVKAVRE